MGAFIVRYSNGAEVTCNAIDANTAKALDDVIAGNATALKPGGGTYSVVVKFGGFLLDGCPLNSKALFGPGLTTAQLGALASINQRPMCSAEDGADYDRFLGVSTSGASGTGATGGNGGCLTGSCGPTTGGPTGPGAGSGINTPTPTPGPAINGPSNVPAYGSGGLFGSFLSGGPAASVPQSTPAGNAAEPEVIQASLLGGLTTFFKGPMGILLIILLVIFVLLMKGGHRGS